MASACARNPGSTDIQAWILDGHMMVWLLSFMIRFYLSSMDQVTDLLVSLPIVSLHLSQSLRHLT